MSMGIRVFVAGLLMALSSAAFPLPDAVAADPATASPTPTATSTACGQADAVGFSITPNPVAAGDLVSVRAWLVKGYCSSPSPRPQPYQVTLYALADGDTQTRVVGTMTATATTGTYQTRNEATFQDRPQRTTLYSAKFENEGPYDYPPASTVTVNRTDGSCAAVLTLTGPATVPTGGVVAVNGTAPDTATVNILFRKRGQTNFQVRRAITPRADRTFSTAFYADDDYRLYASGERCDSQPLLVQAQPVITGPGSIRRDSIVTLLVRAPAGVPVKVYFRRAGTSGYQARRSGTVDNAGRYSTTYLANADYRYYALTGPGIRTSNNGLTQVR